jgi:phospholipid transport system substrate-binding protein
MRLVKRRLRHEWQILLGWLIAFTMTLVSSMTTAQVRAAEELVESTTDEMLVLIKAAEEYVDEDPEQFYVEVEALLRPVIDFPRFARSVMAVHYRDATPEQRERFAEGFKWSLVRTYALALTEFNNGDVRIVPSERPPRRPDRASVKQEIRSSGEIYPVVYSMAQSEDGEWRLRNIIINGINMGLTYRNQFASAVNDPRYGGDMDRAIDGWIASLTSVDATPEDNTSTN